MKQKCDTLFVQVSRSKGKKNVPRLLEFRTSLSLGRSGGAVTKSANSILITMYDHIKFAPC